MKKEFTTKRLYRTMVLCIVFLGSLLIMPGVYSQSISIVSEPTGPLYVGDTIDVDYSASGFTPGSVYYLLFDNDTVLASNTATTGTLTGIVPEGYTPSATLEVIGVLGDINGQTDTIPQWGDLSLAGTTDSYSYDAVSYSPYFDQPGIRRMQLPSLDLTGDSATIDFTYGYWGFPDTLELVVEYSTNGGSSFSPLDSIEYVSSFAYYAYETGIPSAARTANTILRIRQLYSNINNSYSYPFYIQNPTVTIGTFPVQEGSTALAGSPFSILLPSTVITNITAPVADPHFGSVYSGDSIIITANVNGFTADTKFEMVFNTTANIDDPVYHLASGYTATETSPGIWEYKAKLPATAMFNQQNYFWLVPYKGTSYEHGSSISYNFAVSGAGNHIVMGEETIDGAYGIYFTADNIREFETEDYMIADEGTIALQLSRRDNVFSPPNTELIVEYSTDEGVSYTQLGTIDLNQLNVYTSGNTTVELAIPAGALSQNTRFKLRQNEINAQNLDQFYVYDYSILLNTNRFTDGLTADYVANWDNEYVNAPDLDFTPVDVPAGLFYPGTAINLDYIVTVGSFAPNTIIQAVLTTPNPDIFFGEVIAAGLGSISATIPSIGAGVYNVQLQANAPQGMVNSNSRSITVEGVELEILSVIGVPDRNVDGTPYFFSGDDIVVDYNLIGNAPLGVQLQIEDVNNEFVTIATDLPADEQVSGTIPTDIELAPSPRIRLALSDSLYNSGAFEVIYTTTGAKGFPENENDTMVVSVSGLIDSDAFTTYINYEEFGAEDTRSFQTEAFKINNQGKFYLSIVTWEDYYSRHTKVDKVAPIFIQYSTDMGLTWVDLGITDPQDYTINTYVNVTYTLPFEAISDNTMFRVIQNESGILGFSENAWTMDNFNVQSASQFEILSNTFTLNLQQATIALGTLAKTTFGPGEALTVPYNVVGNFGVDVGFAVLIEDTDNNVFVVETSDATGLVQLAANLPVNLQETSTNPDYFDLDVVPYQKTVSVTEPVLGYMEDFDDDEEDFIAIEGGVYLASSYYDMTENGRRSVLSKALPQLTGDSVFFDFEMWFNEAVFPSEGVIVELTFDGGATFQVIDTVFTNDTYTISLATADMTATTHIRWIQYVNFGSGQNAWQLYNMMYKSDESNIITSGYLSLNQPVVIEIDYPNLPSEFNINGQEEVIYSGETFDIEISTSEGITPFPATTEYIFYLGDLSNNVVVDVNGDSVMLGSMTGSGTTNLSIPSSVFKDTYRVLATLQVDDPDNTEPYVYYDMVNILSLDIYNPLLKTLAITEEAYRGDDITVGWELQTGSITTANYYFHLMVNDEIIYTQMDAPVNFVQALPTDLTTGNAGVGILVTTDSLYAEGAVTDIDQANQDEWADQGNMWIWDYTYLRFEQLAEANRVVSNDFDLSTGAKVVFEVDYGSTANDFLESNKIVFEYSIDGGDTYMKLDEFPNDDYELGDGYQWQTYYFAKDAMNDSTQFRFSRQNGNYGYAYVRNFQLTQYSNEAPLDFVSDQISVLNQSVELGTLPSSICPGETVTIDYAINGKFGEKVSHQLQYNVNGGGYNWFPDFEEIGITDGSGSFVISIPENFSGGDYKFRLYSSDATTDNPFNLTSLATEDEMYLVPPINFTGTTLSGDQTLCQTDVKTYSLFGTQAYFVYQARNAETGALYGDPVSNEFGGTQTLFTESIDADIELEIFVQTMSNDGMKTCATGLISDRIEFVVVPERTLFMDDNTTSVWTPSDTAYSICESNPLNLRLDPGYYDGNGNYVSGGLTSVLWYRDDVSNAISANAQLSTFVQSGNYFAELLVDGCKYTTDSVMVDVLSVPTKPNVSSTGALTFCDGESVLLSADMAYPYYRWFGGSAGNNQLSGSSQTIEATTDGVFRLQVSDYPLDLGCLSAKSDPIIVTRIDDPGTSVQHLSGGMYLTENNYVSCGDEITLRVNNEPATYNWTLNGAPYTSADDDDEIRATTTGYYNVQTVFTEKGVTCVYTTPDSIFIQISAELARPSLTLTGDAVFCSGMGSATLTAPAGFPAYIWLEDGDDEVLTVTREVDENTLNIEESGFISVQVVDNFGCESEASMEIEIEVVPLPFRYSDLDAQDYTLCGPQPATIEVTNLATYSGERMLLYQLYNMRTGELEGTPQMKTLSDGDEFVVLESDTVYEETEFGVMVFDQNATGCDIMLEETVIIDVNNAEVTAIGNTLFASTGAQEYQWYRNGEAILGNRGTSTSIEVFDDAEYTVTLVFSFDCILTTEAGEIKNLTGISDQLANDNVAVYPNPVRDILTIEFANAYVGEINVEVSNVSGQVILNRLVDKHNQSMNIDIDMGQFEKGVYFINFITDEHSVVKSIVKQ